MKISVLILSSIFLLANSAHASNHLVASEGGDHLPTANLNCEYRASYAEEGPGIRYNYNFKLMTFKNLLTGETGQIIKGRDRLVHSPYSRDPVLVHDYYTSETAQTYLRNVEISGYNTNSVSWKNPYSFLVLNCEQANLEQEKR